MKKKLSIILLLLFTILFIDTAKAAEINKVEKINYINPLYKDVITEKDLIKPKESNDSSNPIVTYSGNEYVESLDEAGKIVRIAMKNREETIRIKIKTTIDVELCRKLMENAFQHTGISNEGDYLKWQYAGWSSQYSYSKEGDYLYYNITYTVTYYTTKEQENILTNELKKVYNNLNLNGTDYDKLLKIYNYITNNVVYDYTNLNDNDYKLKYTAYAALMNNTSVCQGYAVLLYRMLLDNNIDTRVITGLGNSEPHAWNIIKLGKYYYHADSTWDASYAKYGKYPYFLKGDSNFVDKSNPQNTHEKYSEYTTIAFNTKYPIDYYDYSVRQEMELSGLRYNSNNNTWEYYTNGKVDTTYSGLATNENGTWYVENGKITFKYTGTYKDASGQIYIIRESKVNTLFTGIEQANGSWYYFKNGKIDTTYTGIASNNIGTWYVEKGQITFKYTGTYKDASGKTYTIRESRVNTTIEVKQLNGDWYYFKNGKIDTTYTGIASNNIGTWYIEKGQVTFKYTGTYKDASGQIYIIRESRVNTSFTGIEQANGNWYYFKNGKIDTTYTGIASNNIGTWYIEKGQVTFKYTGTYKDASGQIYIIRESRVNKSFTGIEQANGGWYYFKNGKLDTTYTGIASNNIGTWYVENGKITFKYTGTYKDALGRTYTIKESRVSQ